MGTPYYYVDQIRIVALQETAAATLGSDPPLVLTANRRSDLEFHSGKKGGMSDAGQLLRTQLL